MGIQLSLTLDKTSFSRYMMDNFLIKHILDGLCIGKAALFRYDFSLARFKYLWYLFLRHVGISSGFAPVRAVCFFSTMRLPHAFYFFYNILIFFFRTIFISTSCHKTNTA